MNILITGIHGFVGSNIVNSLKENHIIYGLDIVSHEKDGVIKTYSWNDLYKLPEIDVFIHLAGKAHDTKIHVRQRRDVVCRVSKEYFDVNTGLTKKIFDYFLQSDAKQFFFFSSVKAIADKVEGEILTEDIVPKPIGPYGESKIAAEEYIRSQFNLQTKSVYIFRPCMIHGPGNKGNLNLLYKFICKSIPYPLGNFENKRSFLNIGNLSYIVEQFILQKPESGVYNLADDEPVSTTEIIGLMAASKGKKARIWRMNKSFIKTMAKIGDFFQLPWNSERLQKLTENYVVSNQKMKSALGIQSLPVDVQEGLKRTIETFT